MPNQAEIASTLMPVQVCYLTPAVQCVIEVFVPLGTCLRDAVTLSGVIERHPEIDISTQKIGVFGELRGLDELVASGDRVEIYRPLSVDPKVARERRVAKARKSGSVEGRKWANRVRRRF